jgi:hypothetical protein
MNTHVNDAASYFAGAPLTAPRPTTRTDAAEVDRAVRKYCADLRLNASDTAAAIAWALRSGSHTLQAIREGRARAQQLHWRRNHPTSPTTQA